MLSQCRAIVPNGSCGSFAASVEPVFVLDWLHRLGSNTIFEAPEIIGSRDIYRRGLGGVFRVRVPFH